MIQYEIDEAGGLVYPESAANPSPAEVMYLALRVFRATPCLKPLLDAERLGTAKWEEIVTSEVQRAKISKKLDQMAFTREDLDAPYSQPVLHQLQYWVDFFAIKASAQPSSTFQNYEGHSTNILGMLRYQAHHSPVKVLGFRDFLPNGIMNRALGLALAGSRRKSITLPSLSPTVIISTEPASPLTLGPYQEGLGGLFLWVKVRNTFQKPACSMWSSLGSGIIPVRLSKPPERNSKRSLALHGPKPLLVLRPRRLEAKTRRLEVKRR